MYVDCVVDIVMMSTHVHNVFEDCQCLSVFLICGIMIMYCSLQCQSTNLQRNISGIVIIMVL